MVAAEQEGLRRRKAQLTHHSCGNRFLKCLFQLFYCLGVIAEIGFAANENDWETLTEVQNLGDPLWTDLCQRVRASVFSGRSYLFLDVVEGVWRIDGEADEDDMRIWI